MINSIIVRGDFGKVRHVTRASFVNQWRSAASDFLAIDIDIRSQIEVKAGEHWDKIFEIQQSKASKK